MMVVSGDGDQFVTHLHSRVGTEIVGARARLTRPPDYLNGSKARHNVASRHGSNSVCLHNEIVGNSSENFSAD